MGSTAHQSLVALLGPTNTGKTHFAIERMCGHSSGMIGFPLRLLAREVYDRVVAIKGEKHVALITGEERILPETARYFLCTAESMPVDRDCAFVALDEAQLGTDPERGHVFTDRLLHARGREETMILGSETLRPMIRALVPDAEIVGRPRFSTLSYAGAKKLSRLPPRSAIVAFSAEEVYAVAEMLRRLRGGAAVVLGALSPRTRNAQVAMFQAGEVDYLVATDAIGMGLNMDVAHIAFASLRKFDGKRTRRLTVAEMAQIAGRAGRHQRDGTFGTLGLDEDGAGAFTPEEIEAIENHRFPPVPHLYWRDGRPDLSSVDALIAALERRPNRAELRPAPEAVDLAVLKRMAGEDWVRDRAIRPSQVARLWAASGLPDFRKLGPEHHARIVARVYRHLSEGNGHVPRQWVAEEIARLDTVDGDIDTLSARIAATRTWAYVAQRPDWLADPREMADRTRELETRLSDALHQRLTQRFVDRRTAVLMRDIGRAGLDAVPVKVAEDGVVTVDDEPIGRLDGFRFRVDPAARLQDKKLLLAAAERRLGGELAKRARQLAGDDDAAFALATDPGRPVAIAWRGEVVARLARGRLPTAPRLTHHRALDALTPHDRGLVMERIERWMQAAIERHLGPLLALEAAARDPALKPPARALIAPIATAGGIADRHAIEQALAAADPQDRRIATSLGIRIGALDIFVPALLKPEATRWRIALAVAQDEGAMPELPPPGASSLPTPTDRDRYEAHLRAGYRPLGAQMLRVDLAERVARDTHDRREKEGRREREPGTRPRFAPDPGLATSLGLRPASFAQLLMALGFRKAEGTKNAADPAWVWRGQRARPRREAAPARPGNAFAALAELWAEG